MSELKCDPISPGENRVVARGDLSRSRGHVREVVHPRHPLLIENIHDPPDLRFAPETSQPETCSLDKGNARGCRLAKMMRVLTIGLAVVVILSCATVLITPDPVDDVKGILCQRHSVRGHKLVAAPPAQLRPFLLATFRSFNPLILTLHLSTPHLLALVCVRLC